MSTILWIVVIYLATVAGTYPFILAYKRQVLPGDIKYTPEYMALIAATIPIHNIKIAIKQVKYYFMLRGIKKVLKKIKEEQSGNESEEAKEALDKAISVISEFKLTNKK